MNIEYDKYIPIGRVGEELFIQTYKNRCTEFKDVRNDKDWQRKDVDFLVKTEKNPELTKIEVKVNTATLQTNKIGFELIARLKFGWGLTTESDKICMYTAEKPCNGSIKLLRELWIDTKKWKFAIDRRLIKIEVHYYLQEHIVDYLCDIDELIDQKIIYQVYPVNLTKTLKKGEA